MPRNRARTSVSLEVVLDFTSGRREARVSDLSLSGCYIDSIISVAENEPVKLNLKLHDGEWLSLRGEIVYAFPGTGFGIRFLDLTENDTSLLEHAILLQGGNPWREDETADRARFE